MEANNYIRCTKCKQLFLDCDDKTCPFCGKLIDGVENTSKENVPLIAKHITGNSLATLVVIVIITIVISIVSIVLNLGVYNTNEQIYNSADFQMVKSYVDSGLIYDSEVVDAVRTTENAYNTSVVLVWLFIVSNTASIIAGVLMLIRFRWSYKVGMATVGFALLVQVIESICCLAFGIGFDLGGLLLTAVPKLGLILMFVIYNEKANNPPKPIEPIREVYD